MSDAVDTPSAVQPPSPPPSSPPRAPAPRLSGRLPALLALVLACGLAAVVWQQQASLRTLTAGQAALADTRAALAAAEAEIARAVAAEQSLSVALAELRRDQQEGQSAQQQNQVGLQQQVQGATQTLVAQAAALTRVGEQLDALVARLDAGGRSVLQAQLVGEVLSLLRLAELRLQVAADIEGGRTLLLAVDKQLARTGLPAAESLRAALATYLASLPPADTDGRATLVGRLAAADQAQQGLRASAALLPPSIDEDPSTPVADSAGWLQRLQHWLGQMFVVTRRGQPVTPLLTPEQEWLLHARLSLFLQQAQLAALQAEQGVFERALAQAQSLVSDTLQGDGKQSLLDDLRLLQQQSLQPPLASLDAVIAEAERLQQQLAPAVGGIP